MTNRTTSIHVFPMLALCCFSFCTVDVGRLRAADSDVDFRTQILPILNEHCSHCHGLDEKSRSGGLRLDIREQATKGGESELPAIVPGQPDTSEMIRRIVTTNPDQLMPPASEKKPVPAEKLGLLKTWIAQGARYDQHWAFAKPSRPDVKLANPIADHSYTNAVDWLIAKKHQARGWSQVKMAEHASNSQIARRIYLDVIGIPPTPEQIAAFDKDGINTTIDRLIDDERYGERWARPWLDVARYSDTNGYEKDMQRDQWIWRDWVIQSLNRDMPYNQFVIEQLAGDLLPNATQDQKIATGFLRNSMINEEGAIVPEEFRMVEMFDRMDCVGKAILGVSLQCCQCHSHKFDPITQDDYYGLFAFLNNSYEARSWVYSADQQKQLQSINEQLIGLSKAYLDKHPESGQSQKDWAAKLLAERPEWKPLRASLLETISGLNHPVQEADDSILMVGHSSNDVFMLADSNLNTITGLQFEVLPHGELPFRGPGRNGVGGWDMRELELWVQRPGVETWEKQTLAKATADFSNKEEKSSDGKNASGPVDFIIDGKDETTWKSDRGVGRRNQASVAVVQLEKPITDAANCKLKVVWRMGDMIGSCRISITDSANPVASPADHGAVLALLAGKSGVDARDPIFASWLKTRDDAAADREAIEAQWQKFPVAMTSVLHMEEREPERSRPTHLLERGVWTQMRDEVKPHVFTSFHAQKQTNEPKRLQMARWIVDEQSPLAARVAVNRVWHNIFGQGLVELAEDFGTRAPMPEHQELLDWLANDFVEHGWSQKHLIRTILKSEAYQRSSVTTPELTEIDPKNRWLTRGPRFRVDAEMLRDITLAVSGLIHQKAGGPSVIPPVPQNVLDYNYTYPSYWKPAEAPERYRRSVYLFRKRSMPDPVMSAFDSPNGDSACARRVRSNTPLAALTGLNEPIFVEAAQALALRILRESGLNDDERIERGFLLCTSRNPTEVEKQELRKYLITQRTRIADGWLNPRELLTGDPAKLKDLPTGVTPQDAGAWVLASRVLLNLDETISKN